MAVESYRREVFLEGVASDFLESLERDQVAIYSRYEGYVEQDIARELARVNLPLSLYTQFYWQIDLHNLFHFLKLRLDAHAQLEIRAYGEVLSQCAKAVAPIAYASFEKHVLRGLRLSMTDCLELTAALKTAPVEVAPELMARLISASKPDGAD